MTRNTTVPPLVMNVEGGKHIKAWIRGVDLGRQVNDPKYMTFSNDPQERTQLERAAYDQLENVARMPFIHKHVAVMPDVHVGKGATVGSVIATKGAIIPAAVGVDIGCGMMAVQTSLKAEDLPDNLLGVRTAIEAAVPHGRTNNGGEGDRGAWGNPPSEVAGAMLSLPAGRQEFRYSLSGRLCEIYEKHPKLKRAAMRSPSHLGTLGTGNHFVEVCLDLDGAVWIMLHSGSRGIGNAIGTYFINLAKEDMRRWFINVPDVDLAYLPEGSEHFGDYMKAVNWAQEFAKVNRQIMMRRVIKAITGELGRSFEADLMAVNCHHNYVAHERHWGEDVLVTRKGAVRAGQGDLGIIPGSMGARSFIVRGLGNPDSFHSCSHGAGRRMSRTEASKTFTLADHAIDTFGIECRKDEDVIDETPRAYKNIDQVMHAQADLVEVVAELRQVLCVKG